MKDFNTLWDEFLPEEKKDEELELCMQIDQELEMLQTHRQLVARMVTEGKMLPAEMREEARTALEEAGVCFGKIAEEDPLFRYVVLRPKWVVTKPMDYNIYFELFDDKERKRASFVYISFSDDDDPRDTNGSTRFFPQHRYGYHMDYDQSDRIDYVITDCGQEIHRASVPRHSSKTWMTASEAEKIAQQWLNTNYPDWGQLNAYWD